ncbi:MAG TPA: FG-GAP-like repeat-containing protein [Pyrinomonadaceae bacterium]|jgi:hypothetical protein
MRNIFLFFIVAGVFCLLPIEFAAQISNPGKSSLEGFGKPDGQEKQTKSRELPFSRVYEFIKPGASKITRLPKLTEAEKSSPAGEKKLQVGRVRQLNNEVSSFSQGDSFAVADGKVWITQITSEEAVQTRVQFSNMNLPEGGRVFVYSATDPNEIYGPYKKTGESETGEFWTPPVKGDSIVIEYFAPDESAATKAKLPFLINEISHIYRDPFSDYEQKMGPPDYPQCAVNVPAEWSEVAKSVAHLQFVSGGSVYICTGTLLNSTIGDFDPILLTANHCISTAAEAQSLRAYWLYNSGDFPTTSTLRTDGATLLNTGITSDYTLVRMRGIVPLRQGITYSGWDAATTAVNTPVVGIHHPNGSYKRFSSGAVTQVGNFIRVSWSSGITEGGSSGSGIWKGSGTNARLIGTLNGGTIGCTNPSDNYGSFAVTYQAISSNLQGGPDDEFDVGNGNDTRAAAVGIGQGAYSNLSVKWQDSDWYAITVPAGYKVTATTGFTHNNGDIDLELYRSGETSPIVSSNTSTNSETVTHTNNAGTTIYYLNVFLYNGARNDYNLNIALERVSAGVRSPYDFDGDSKTDLSIFRPTAGEWWYLRSSDGGNRALQFGTDSDRLVPADFTGDGKTDIAFFRPSSGQWFVLRSEDASFYAFPFGTSGDIPAPADYDGDGRADAAVFRPSNQTWYISRSSGGTTIQQFGQTGDAPVVADYDGDNKADIAIYRPASGQWWIQRSSLGTIAYQFGNNTDKPVQGDYTGDGKADVAFFRPSTNEWFVLRSENSSFYSFPFGAAGDTPSPGDYDGDGRFDAAVFRSSNNTWFAQRSSSNTLIQNFGVTGDKPVPNAFVP